MNITIDQEDREVLADLYESVLEIKQLLLKLSVLLIGEIKKGGINFIMSLSEFAPQEIKAHGLEEILFRRAMRFFGLKMGEEVVTQSSVSRKKKKARFILKRFMALCFLPVYGLILLIILIRGKKKKKYVKNKFKT